MKATIANAVEAASADMSWKAIDRYSKDYIELQQKDKVRFYKTPDAILQRQLEIYDSVVAAKVKENPLFKEIVESQVAFARRATQWELDTVVSARDGDQSLLRAEGEEARSDASAIRQSTIRSSVRMVPCRIEATRRTQRRPSMTLRGFLHTHRRHQHLGRQGGSLARSWC